MKRDETKVGDVVDFPYEQDILKCAISKIRDDGYVDLEHWETLRGYEMKISDIKSVYRKISITD